jgi:hypothetical protein
MYGSEIGHDLEIVGIQHGINSSPQTFKFLEQTLKDYLMFVQEIVFCFLKH